MAPVKLKFVVSFSSQDKGHKVSNLLGEGQGAKRWLSDPQDRTGQIEATFQLERPCHLAYLDIGVIWCASIEVRVGKSDWPRDQSYVTLVPTKVLMSPVDARLSRHVHRTCMFSKADFSEGVNTSTAWDRIQLVGRQPWRKDVQLGLSFLRVRCVDGSVPTSSSLTMSDGDVSTGTQAEQKLAVAAIKEHFWGNKQTDNDEDAVLRKRLQKISATTEGGSEDPSVLSRNARMVLLANKNSKPIRQTQPNQQQASVSSSEKQQQPSLSFSDEVHQYFDTLSIRKKDIETLKVSDMRHKFEKLKWRKLTADEKRIFYTCCQDLIGRLFDDDNDSENNSVGGVSAFSPKHVTGLPSRQVESSKENTPKSSKVSRSGQTAGCTDSVQRDSDKLCSDSPKLSHRWKLNHAGAEGDQISSPSAHRQSGGFLTNRLLERTSGNSASRHDSTRKSCTEDTERAEAASLSNIRSPPASSPRTTAGRNSESGIDPSLLSSHKKFLKARMRNICPASSGPPHSSASVGEHSCEQPLSAYSDKHPGSPLSGPKTKRTLKKITALPLTAKRSASPLRSTATLTPAKRQSRVSGNDSLDDSSQDEDNGQWLSARRGPISGRSVQKRPHSGCESYHGDRSSSPKSHAVRDRGRKREQGRGRGAVNRCLEMPDKSATTTPATSASFAITLSDIDDDDDDPHRNELQIDEDATFVECPLCEEMFPSDTVSLHASECLGPSSSSGAAAVHDGVSFVQCPLCENMFDAHVIAAHASACGL